MKNLKYLCLDKFGIAASTACAIHCAAIPFVITVLPFWGIGFLSDIHFEIAMIGLSIILGIWSLAKSYSNVHQNPKPIVILIVGFTLIGAGHVPTIEALEPILIPIGGICIAIAHLVNLKLSKTCRHARS
ncbi:MerC domain-containing protein [Pedobacter sandarakinus]|uniref:MerC domain-containing protein n=1 Tax=Pedobacter sandarakinus TaxID=353156 RepID=UPI0022475583|nr:MerC domain-containing protein [Pedobacter sandarakinus]MCX2574425.1 MerC domain-containing protein [Pedobacter sandarakinus]